MWAGNHNFLHNLQNGIILIENISFMMKKGRDLTRSSDKIPYINGEFKKESDSTRTSQNFLLLSYYGLT